METSTKKDILPTWVQKPIMYSLLFLAVAGAAKLTPLSYFETQTRCCDMKMRLILTLVFFVASLFLVKYLVSEFEWGRDWTRIFSVSVYLALLYFFVSSSDVFHMMFGNMHTPTVTWGQVAIQTALFFALALGMVRLPISCI